MVIRAVEDGLLGVERQGRMEVNGGKPRLLRRLQNFGGLAHALLHHGGDLGGGLGHAPQQRLVPDDGRVLHHVALVGVISISWAR